MRRSTERILTTHTGSLPRPPALTDIMVRRDRGELPPAEALSLPASVKDAVTAVVQRQAASGIDIVNDGEMGKIGYATYVRERLTGFDGTAQGGLSIGDLVDTPELAQRSLAGLSPATPACTGPIRYVGHEAVGEDIANLAAAAKGREPGATFMTAASPGVIAIYLENQHYPDEATYLAAVAVAMRDEYTAIVDAGMTLQIDAPDLAMGRHIGRAVMPVEDFRRQLAARIELLDEATRDVPSERLRLHLCWGNYIGPHHHDVPLRDIVDIVLRSRAGAILFEAANPRHAHEWRVFEEVRLPDDKVLIPGVIDTCTNYVEHPELVAQRIGRFADLVGRERVIAGTDCGFASFASFMTVDPKVAWMKLAALVEGAAIASKRLWS